MTPRETLLSVLEESDLYGPAHEKHVDDWLNRIAIAVATTADSIDFRSWINQFELAIEYEDSVSEAITTTGDIARKLVYEYERRGHAPVTGLQANWTLPNYIESGDPQFGAMTRRDAWNAGIAEGLRQAAEMAHLRKMEDRRKGRAS